MGSYHFINCTFNVIINESNNQTNQQNEQQPQQQQDNQVTLVNLVQDANEAAPRIGQATRRISQARTNRRTTPYSRRQRPISRVIPLPAVTSESEIDSQDEEEEEEEAQETTSSERQPGWYQGWLMTQEEQERSENLALFEDLYEEQSASFSARGFFLPSDFPSDEEHAPRSISQTNTNCRLQIIESDYEGEVDDDENEPNWDDYSEDADDSRLQAEFLEFFGVDINEEEPDEVA